MANDDLLKKLADNFAELSARERKFMLDKLGIRMVPLPTLEQVQRAFEAARAKIRDVEERMRAGAPPPRSRR